MEGKPLKFVELTAARPVADMIPNGCKFMVPANNIVAVAALPQRGCMVTFSTGLKAETLLRAETVETYEEIKRLLTSKQARSAKVDGGRSVLDAVVNGAQIEQHNNNLKRMIERLNKNLTDHDIAAAEAALPRNGPGPALLVHEIEQREGAKAQVGKKL
jgi:hypothetical protein